MKEEKIITLEEYENKKGCLDSYEAAAIIKLLCLALGKLHQDKITYRELCPANILLLCNDGEKEEFIEARLAESAAPRKHREGATEDTVLMGIERYAAPEQYGFTQSMPATDIFAVGVVFNEMLTGKTPEEEKTGHPVCAYIIEKCCSLDWKKRYKNVAVLLKDIDWYLSHKQCGNKAWNIHKNRKFIAAGVAFLAGCAGILLCVGFAMRSIHKSDIDIQVQKSPVEEQIEEQKGEYQKYTVDNREMVIYYPEGFHYLDKTEEEHSVTIFFAPDTGNTGMLAMMVADNDWQYSLEEGTETLLQGIIDAYPGGEVITKEVDDKQIDLYYKTTVNQKDIIVGIQAQLEQNDEKAVTAFGLYDAEEDKRYREYFDLMMKKIEY